MWSFVRWNKNLLLLDADSCFPFQQPWVEVKRATYQEASVHWWHPDAQYPAYWLVMLIRTSDATERACFFFVEGRMMELYLPLILTAGSQYRLCVAALSHIFLDTRVPSFLIFDEGVLNFRAGTSSCFVGWWLYRIKCDSHLNCSRYRYMFHTIQPSRAGLTYLGRVCTVLMGPPQFLFYGRHWSFFL